MSPPNSSNLPPPRTTAHLEDLQVLLQLCEHGKLCEVDQWIGDGRPLQLSPETPVRRRPRSALEIALSTGQHSLSLLLLRSGYRPDLDPRSPFDIALSARRTGLLYLLFQFGADPHRAELEDLFDTYDTQLFERFRACGVDLTRDHAMADALAYHTSNKPLFGFARRYRQEDPAIQTELDAALCHHAREGNQKGVMLCLWAGADPYAPAPDLEYGGDDDPELMETAVEGAVHRGNLEGLQRFRPDPARIDFDALYQWAANRQIVQYLASIQPPRDLTPILQAQCGNAALSRLLHNDWGGVVLAVLDCGVAWAPPRTTTSSSVPQACRSACSRQA